jgi:hypothetical protein
MAAAHFARTCFKRRPAALRLCVATVVCATIGLRGLIRPQTMRVSHCFAATQEFSPFWRVVWLNELTGATSSIFSNTAWPWEVLKINWRTGAAQLSQLPRRPSAGDTSCVCLGAALQTAPE